MEIRGASAAEKLVWETIANLKLISDPPPRRSGASGRACNIEDYEQIEVEAFLTSMDKVFEEKSK